MKKNEREATSVDSTEGLRVLVGLSKMFVQKKAAGELLVEIDSAVSCCELL